MGAAISLSGTQSDNVDSSGEKHLLVKYSENIWHKNICWRCCEGKCRLLDINRFEPASAMIGDNGEVVQFN